jgi:hypothetical protein
MELKNAESDLLLNDIAIGATTGTLTGGNFGIPATPIYLTFDYNVSAKYEVKLVTVAGANMTVMSHISGANVAHTAGCKVGRMINAEIIDDIVNTLTLGYSEITSNFTTATVNSDVDVTGLATTVTVPAGGRRVKIWVYLPGVYATGVTADQNIRLSIKEGATVLNKLQVDQVGSSWIQQMQCVWSGVPTAGAHTYKATIFQNATAGNCVVQCQSTQIAFILVELI